MKVALQVCMAIATGMTVAILVWFGGIFISGEYYWFMQTGGYPDDASLTRMQMLYLGTVATAISFIYLRNRK